MIMNTSIEYLFRDAGNYKVWNNAVIRGILTADQIDTIIDSLDCGLWFLPHLVGLPEKQFETWDPELDHPFFELDRSWITTEDLAPTVEMTPEELTQAFAKQKGRWLWASLAL